MREVHGGSVFEIAIGPLIRLARDGLQTRNIAGGHIRLQSGGEAEEDLSVKRNRLRAGNIGRQSDLAREALLSIEPSPGGASTNTCHSEEIAYLVTCRPEDGIGSRHDIIQRVAAEDHSQIILLQTYWPEVGRGLVAGKRHGLLDRIDGMALFLGCRQVNRQIIWVARSCLKKFRSFLQAWDGMLEIRKSPGYQNVHSAESRRWKLL